MSAIARRRAWERRLWDACSSASFAPIAVEPETRDEISECLEMSERRADTCEAADCERADTCERTERASSSVTGCAAADPPSAASVSAACCPALSSVAICFSRFAASADSSFSTRCFQHLTRAESGMSEGWVGAVGWS